MIVLSMNGRFRQLEMLKRFYLKHLRCFRPGRHQEIDPPDPAA